MPITFSYGAAPTYVKIASQTLSSAGTLTFSNIPQGYTDLVISFNNAQSATGTPGITLRFNGDTGTNYSNTHLEGNGTTATSSRITSGTYTNTGYNIGLSATSNQPASATINVQNYSNSLIFKTMLTTNAQPLGSAPGVGATVSLWRSTSPITSINVTAQAGNFASGLNVTIYGIKAAIPEPKAIGGSSIVSDSKYWYHVFRSTGTFVPKSNLTAEIMVIAGGGGGATVGGGGAGGFRVLTAQSLNAATTYTATIGAGGNQSNGTNSSFSGSGFTTISSTGGGKGGELNTSATSGGSGGGSSSNSSARNGGAGNAGGYSPVEGFAGGNNVSTSAYQGAGGGGAGAVGSNATSTVAGAGGIGTSAYSSWGLVTNTGEVVSGVAYYAGGGGGTNATGQPGGAGGGGSGSSSFYNITNFGLQNTGGGAGGGYWYGNATAGSGLIIVRYPF